MIECVNYKRVNKGSFLGFADFYVQKWGVCIYSCTVFQKNDSMWINFPSREIMDDNNDKKFLPMLRFLHKEHHDLFMVQAKKALEEYCKKEALEQEKLEEDSGGQNQENQIEIPF